VSVLPADVRPEVDFSLRNKVFVEPTVVTTRDKASLSGRYRNRSTISIVRCQFA
jgi:hypothetical protein